MTRDDYFQNVRSLSREARIELVKSLDTRLTRAASCERVCDICGKRFESDNPNRRYCSQRCNVKSYRNRQRARRGRKQLTLNLENGHESRR